MFADISPGGKNEKTFPDSLGDSLRPVFSSVRLSPNFELGLGRFFYTPRWETRRLSRYSKQAQR